MPQLNPGPWFVILFLSWSVLLTIVAPKVLSYVFPNEPNPQTIEALDQQTWTWSWS